MEKRQPHYELEQDRYPRIYTANGRDQSCPMHFHRKIELLYNLDEEKNVFVNNKRYVLHANNLCVVDSYSLHCYEFSNGKQALLTLPTIRCERYFEYRRNKILCGNVIDDEKYCKEKIWPYFKNLLEYEKSDNYSVQANVDMLLANICSKIGLKEASDTLEPESMDTILEYIEQNYNKELTLTSLASHFGYSKYYFSRIFNNMFHTSINDYLSVIRLEKTFQYLNAHKCSITTAAFNNGFNSMPTFYRVLKKNHGEQNLKLHKQK